ncbi:MAG: transcriptional repressor [Planctomycetia bacterium]|nr:transcriptional repressor [Planctomycetia bacterium]
MSITAQRRIVFEILIQSRKHPTADQVYEAAIERLPDISRASVYRILDTFVRFGIIRKIEHPGVAVRYDGKFCHHHMICSKCGAIEDCPENYHNSIQYPKEISSGFKIENYSITFHGICKTCQNINIKRIG